MRIIFPPLAFVTLLCACPFCFDQVLADHDTSIYSDPGTAKGIVVKIDSSRIHIREKSSGGLKRFYVYDGGGGPEIEVTVDGSPANFDEIKVGMGATISFYRKVDKRKIEEPFPMISIDAVSDSKTSKK